MKKLNLILLGLLPIMSFAKAPDCHNWPMNMTEMWMRSAGIVDFKNLNIPKTKITLLASEKKGKDLYTQIYYFVFYDQKGKSYEVITKNEASYEECSMSQVNSYLISKRDINY
ncbi:hypothetical protein [Snodgrassella alvi]|uniref:Uncharacterized protein n=1 Tax=Snodgrassella alvi TaxID=1196083 RepID=A0A855G7L0_9NEIS|nr:hypothetical protein [Snodgrassella alvi]PIT28370.1 hypothetical protein BGI37_02010 [Snodgrassella alvi]PIT59925.1 hypothetical protein BHC57_06540 [Snodgrassella alvi]